MKGGARAGAEDPSLPAKCTRSPGPATSLFRQRQRAPRRARALSGRGTRARAGGGRLRGRREARRSAIRGPTCPLEPAPPLLLTRVRARAARSKLATAAARRAPGGSPGGAAPGQLPGSAAALTKIGIAAGGRGARRTRRLGLPRGRSPAPRRPAGPGLRVRAPASRASLFGQERGTRARGRQERSGEGDGPQVLPEQPGSPACRVRPGDPYLRPLGWISKKRVQGLIRDSHARPLSEAKLPFGFAT